MLLYARRVQLWSSLRRPAFTRNLLNYMKDDDYKRLQAAIGANPRIGEVMPRTGGFRKMRWGDPRRGKGTRGGMRIIYYHFPSDDQIWLMTIYDKNEAADLTPSERKGLKAAIVVERKMRELKRMVALGRSRRIH